MITYLMLSYFIVFIWCIKRTLFDMESVKSNFKLWLFFPVVLPFLILVKFWYW